MALALLTGLPLAGAGVVEEALAPYCAPLPPDVAHHVCTYQADAYVPGDAEPTCALATRTIAIDVHYPGMLMPYDGDQADAYHFTVTSALVGTSMVASVVSSPGVESASSTGEHTLSVVAPASATSPCGSVVGTATPDDPLAFTPSVDGTYAVVVTPAPGDPLPLPVAGVCHLMCTPVVNATGYEFSVMLH